MGDINIIFSYNIKQTSDDNNKKYRIGDYSLIQYHILRTNTIIIVWKTVWKITNEILGEKGFKVI